MVIPLPVEEQCRGVLSEPLPNLQLLTGTTAGLQGLSLRSYRPFFYPYLRLKSLRTHARPSRGDSLKRRKRPGMSFRFFFFVRLKNVISFCPRRSRPSPESEASVALFYAETSKLQKVVMRSKSRAAPLCVPNSKWYLSANHYANPHASRTSQTPTLNLQLHPFIPFLTVPPHPGGSRVTQTWLETSTLVS